MLLVDSGNFSDNPTPQGDAKTRTLLEAMGRLGYEVVNVGERDIRMGYPEFRRRTENASFQFISANIVDRATQEPIFAPHAVVQAVSLDGASEVRVGLIGAVRYNPIFLKAGPNGGNIVIAHPEERIRKEVEALRKKRVDVIVLLAALHMNDAKKIASDVPGIDFVLGSYGGQFSAKEERVGDTTVLYCGNRGQRVGESRVFFGDKKKRDEISEVTIKLHMLTRHYPPDKEMLDFVNSTKPPEAPEAPPATTSSVLGESGARAAR